jgi:hypothetical protein
MTTSLLVRRHLLHLRKKNKEMTMSQGGSSSSATPEKENKEMTTSQGSSLSSTTLEKKNKEMMTS